MRKTKRILAVLAALAITLALMPTVAFAATIQAGDFAALQTAISSANNGDTIEITASFEITDTLTITEKSITITSGGGPYTLTRGSGFSGNMFNVDYAVGSGLTLSNIVLDGNKGTVPNAYAAIVFSSGPVTIESGAVIKNNASQGVFIVEISIGGVFYRGSLTMTGGEISGNDNRGISSFGNVTISGGKITGNTRTGDGGGISIYDNYGTGITLTISGGEISNNSAVGSGGGILSMDAAVNITGGTFFGNTAADGDSFIHLSNATLTIGPMAIIKSAVCGKITGSNAPGGLAATVQLKQNGSNVGDAVTAGADGTFSFANVSPGEGYTVEASMSGYVTVTSDPFSIEHNDVTGKNVTLTPTSGGGGPAPNVYTVTQNPGTYSGSGSAVATIEGPYNEFTRLILGGNPVAASNYTKAEGSTVITLNESYVKTLAAGTHTFRAEFTNGYADFTVTIKAAESTPTPAPTPTPAAEPKPKPDLPPPIVGILTDVQKSGDTFSFKIYIANASGNMPGATVTVRLNEKYSTTVTIGEDGVGHGTIEAPGYAWDTIHISTRPNLPGAASVGTAYQIYSDGRIVRR